VVDVSRLVFAGTHARNHRACVGVGVWLVQEENHEDDHGAHSDADRAASLHPANGGLCCALCGWVAIGVAVRGRDPEVTDDEWFCSF
jgi:hypothetical protein